MLATCGRCRFELPDIRPSRIAFPLSVAVRLEGVPALVMDKGALKQTDDNRFLITLRRDYPFTKPVVTWLTDIFHPNISPPSDGGVVCTRLLQEWRAERSLLSLVEGIASLVEHPNKDEPLSFDSCLSAAEYFSKGDGY